MHPRRSAVLAGLAAAAIGLTGCAASPSEDEESVLRIGGGGTTLALGVHKITEGSANLQAGDALYDRLWIEEGATTFTPWLAEEFSYNDDRTVLSITLRDDVVFADGSALDPTDVEAVVAYYKNAETKLFTGLTPTVEITGDHTLDIVLDQPDREFLKYMGFIRLAPSEVWDDPEAFAEEATGSGPYVIDEANTVADSVYTFVRNTDYWNPGAFPYDRIELRLFQDGTASLNALKSGQIDLTYIDAATANEAEGSGFTLYENATSVMLLNLGDRRGEILPAIGDERVRRAIAIAIDRETVAETLESGYAIPSNQIFGEGSPGYRPDRVDENAYDPERAKDLLAEAGFPDGFDLAIPSYAPFTGKYEPYIQQALGDIGIRVTYLPMTDANWLTEFMSGKYPVIIHGELLSQADEMADPGHWWNPWHNQQPEVDELLTILDEGTEEEAIAAYDAIGDIMLDEAWFAPLGQPLTIIATSPDLEIPTTLWNAALNLKDIRPAS